MTDSKFLNVNYRKIRNIVQQDLDENAPYVAGLMDGEGAFCIINPKDTLTFYPCIQLKMTHENTVAKAADLFGVSYSRREEQPPHKDSYCLRVTTQAECEQICDALGQYAITKQEQISLMLKFLELSQKKTKENMLEIVNVFIAVKKANDRGQGIDFNAIQNNLRKRVIEAYS
jgi:hypothetical protein